MGIETQHDFYNLTHSKVIKNGGQRILFFYKYSFAASLSAVYPEFTWYKWLFSAVPSNFWASKDNQREYVIWLAEKCGYDKIEDYYNLTYYDFMENGGSALLSIYYSNSAVRCIQALFPEQNWNIWEFQRVPAGFWDDPDKLSAYMKWLGEKLHITKMEDWYGVTAKHFAEHGGASIIHKMGIMKLLKKAFPDYQWDTHFVQSSKKKSEKFLSSMLRDIFKLGEDDLLTNYHHPALSYSKTRMKMVLDIFVTKLSLAFEYQGQQHFAISPFFDNRGFQEYDKEKEEACKRAGITLIHIPFWWDYKKESLIATIAQFRPDIFPNPGKGKPIPSTPPPKITYSCEPPEMYLEQLNSDLKPEFDRNQVMENIFGLRMFWDGTRFHLRNGMTIVPPPDVFPFPGTCLDCFAVL